MEKASPSSAKAASVKRAVKPKAPAAKRTTAKAQEVVKNVAAKAPIKPVKKIAAPAQKPETEPKEKVKKTKLVRDSFTMPEAEYAVLGEVKKACLKAGIEVKKSELLRVGVALIRQLDLPKLKEILAVLPALKAGRPKKYK